LVEFQYYNTMACGASLLLSLSSTYALIIIDLSISFRSIAKKTNFRDFSDIFGFRCTLQFILHHSFFIEKLEKPLYSNNIITNNIKREFQSHRTLSSSSQTEPHDTYHHILHQLQSLKLQCIDNRWSIEDCIVVAMGLEKMGNTQIGSLLDVKSILPCLMSTAHAIEIINFPVSVKDTTGTLSGSIVENIRDDLHKVTNVMLGGKLHKEYVIQSLPLVFHSIIRPMLNALFQLLGDTI